MSGVESKSVLVHAPISWVWENLSRVKNWKTWIPGVMDVELLETPKPGAVGRVSMANASSALFVKFLRVEQNRLIEWEVPSLLGTRTSYSCQAIENAEGAVVTFEVSCAGLFAKPATFFLRSRLSERIEQMSAAFKTRCEKLARARETEEQPSLRSSLAQK